VPNLSGPKFELQTVLTYNTRDKCSNNSSAIIPIYFTMILLQLQGKYSCTTV